MAKGKINGGQVRTANDPNTPAPLFNFYEYQTGKTYKNDPTQVDFVTCNGNLYVCTDAETYASEPTPERNGGFILIVKKGEDGQQGVQGRPGINGSTPEIKVKFEGKQLVVYDAITQTRLSSSPELVGPTWKPVQKDNKITWKLEEGTPADIDLEQLRPKEERPVLFRLNSDNTKRSDEETGPGYYIQWKREGNEEWTDLMSISELMNIALAGVSFWWADDEHGATDNNGDPIKRLHFGHKKVIRATYDASKLGNKRIAEVERGDVLFDAGEVPFANYDDDIAALNAFLCDLQNDLDIVRNLIPNDYVKSINGKRPNNSGEVTIDDYYTKQESDSKYLQNVKTLAGQSLAGTGDLGLKTVNGKTLLYVPNPNYTDTDVQVGTVRKIIINNVEGNPNNDGTVTMTIPTGSGPGTGDGTGIDDIQFELNNGNLRYRVSVEGSWHEWTNIPLPGGVTGGEHVDLKIENGHLYIRYDGGQWRDLGTVNADSSLPNAFVNARIDGNNLIFTKADNTTHTVTLPSTGTGSGSVVTVQQILSTGTKIATITVDGTPVDIYAPRGGSVTPGSGSGSGSGSGDGETPLSYRTFMVYQRTGSPTEAPATNTITAATWNLNTDELVLTSEYWSNHPGNKTGANTACLWMTSATFRSDTQSRVGDWETPICLTSAQGDGYDSTRKEFIYRSVKETEYAAVMAVRPVGRYDVDQDTTNDNQDDNIPNSDNLAERQWLDNPVGITPEYPYELCAYRRKVNGVWSQYSMPFVWSHWGEDGLDGDGVEYVFRTATASEVDEANNSITLKSSVTRPSNSWDYDSAESPWTDDPSGVNANNPYEFCSQRKTKIVTDNEGVKHTVWDVWSEPALWSIYKEGPQGPSGGVGPIGPKGDEYEKVYGLAGNSVPAVKSIDATVTDANQKTAADDGYLPNFVFDGISVAATATPSGVSSVNRYEYESIRRKHNGVWGSFSAPALHSNFVEAGLTQEQLENIKHDVEDAVSDDLDAAVQRIAAAEDRLDDIDGENSTFLQDNASSLVGILTNYEDANHKSFADIVVDGSQGAINLRTAVQTAQGDITTVQTDMNAVKGIIGNYADYSDGQGGYNTVKSLLDAKAASAEISATYATKQSVTDARTEWNAANATLQSSVAKATYVWVEYDSNGDVVDVHEYDPEHPSTTPQPSAQGNTFQKKLAAEAMSVIRQKVNEVDILANEGPSWAQIIAKASAETGSSIILDANNINLSGTTNAQKAVIGEATIADSSITNGTITNATIDNCTINSSIESANYSGANHTGFMIDPENNEFALYSTNGTRIDSNNGLVLGANQTISWDHITGAPSSSGGDISDPDLAAAINDWTVTTITQDNVTTRNVYAENLTAKNVKVLDSLTVNGTPVGTGNNATSLAIVFGNMSTTTDQPNTIYFLYSQS